MSEKVQNYAIIGMVPYVFMTEVLLVFFYCLGILFVPKFCSIYHILIEIKWHDDI